MLKKFLIKYKKYEYADFLSILEDVYIFASIILESLQKTFTLPISTLLFNGASK